MPEKNISLPPAEEPWHIPPRAHAAVALTIVAVTGGSLDFFYRHGLSNLYGDGLAHLEGARRIFDSLTPGYQEIGSVWLPLYHLICAPLAANDFLWRSGLAGGIVSSVAFALTCYLLFRLGAEINQNLAAGLVTLAGALLCPSFLYLASTPLTEPLALMWAVLVAYALFRYTQAGSWRWLTAAALAAFCGTLTRYDAWNVLPFAALFVLLARAYPWRQRLARMCFFAGVAGAGPLLWLAHNAHRYHNPLEFYNGVGSAADIYAHQLATTAFPYPTDGSILISAHYYVEDLKLVLGSGALVLAALGLVAWCAMLCRSRRGAVAVLFIIPLAFYVEAMAHAAVPLYVPTLFPHGHYNIRYGVQMLPAVALFPSFLLGQKLGRQLRLLLLLLTMVVLGWQFVSQAAAGAAELAIVQEGIRNTPCRAQRQDAIIDFLRAHYDGGRILVAAGEWPCVMPRTGLRLADTISSRNRKYWAKVRAVPQQWVTWIIRGDGDEVDELMESYPQAYTDYVEVVHGEFAHEGGFRIYRLLHK